MLQKLQLTENKFESFLLYFIIIQPILDLLTSFSILVLNIDTTAGIIVRFLVMLFSLVYILIKSFTGEGKRYLIYLLFLGSAVGISLINNLLIKDPVSLSEEVKFAAKVVYPLVMIFSYILAFKAFKKSGGFQKKVIKYITYSTLIINVSMILAIITGTSNDSYINGKAGSLGWFFAANPLGATLAICLPVVLLYSINNTTKFSQLFYWIPTLLSVYSLIMVGTKVGYGAILIVLFLGLFMSLVEFFKHRKSGNRQQYLLNTSISGLVLIIVILITPYTPLAANTSMHLSLLGIDTSVDTTNDETEQSKDQNEQNDKSSKPKQKNIVGQVENIDPNQMENLLLSSREVYVDRFKGFFDDAPTSQKILGMGYAGNYEEDPKTIEMDFHDIFFSFGILGFIIIILPLIYFGIRIIIRVLKRLLHFFTLKYVLIASGLALALGIAFTAGHVLTAPAVSIFFSILFAFLIVDLEID
ncbi:hypothetical protein CU633_07070 [Bacillus sp. V3-13]|uniref:O-antigen ligase family protein n=1 Tax=Bacillus sp. V3-13 TaxID=2053728 RepID=UPI000C779739|nr:O-antigen ligase family protein [Bacillus sp. V3-13]PLR78268.1 hypothetical protein CU633_07070 [Bacillus sp. V3-13]